MVSTVRILANGTRGGVVTGSGLHERAKRGEVSGWSVGSSRRNTAFLMSVDAPALTCGGLFGLTFTFTVGAEVPEAGEWARACKNLRDRMRRLGCVRYHMVTEFQARGAPHLHGIAYFRQDWLTGLSRLVSALVDGWLELAEGTGARRRGQVVRLVESEVGWLEYLAKHAARGVQHYQRARATMPASWRSGSSGRMWQRGGDWPQGPELELELDDVAWFRLRRLTRAYRLAKVRSWGKGRGAAIRAARRSLRHPDARLSRLRGLAVWLPQHLALSMVANVHANGGQVSS